MKLEAPRWVRDHQQPILGHMYLVFGVTVIIGNRGTGKIACILMKPVPRFWPRFLGPTATFQALSPLVD